MRDKYFTYPKYFSASIDRKLKESLISLHFYWVSFSLIILFPPTCHFHLLFSLLASIIQSSFYLFFLWFTRIYFLPAAIFPSPPLCSSYFSQVFGRSKNNLTGWVSCGCNFDNFFSSP